MVGPSDLVENLAGRVSKRTSSRYWGDPFSSLDELQRMMQNQAEKKPSIVHDEEREKDVGLILSADAKPRLKWTPDLHQRFVDAVTLVGGIHKATPKRVMKVMGVPKLTLFHLKSHLQKYRLKSQQSGACTNNNKVAANGDTEITDVYVCGENKKNYSKINESLQIAKTLQMQLEVQQKLHDQIEVQRHLQLRIEAQGKYLQSVLKRAQETLAGCHISSSGLEAAGKRLSNLASSVNLECPGSSISEITEISGVNMGNQGTGMKGNCYSFHQPQLTDCCSMDSCLTTSESTERKDENLQSLRVSEYDAEKSGTSILKSTETNSNSNNNLSKTSLRNRPLGKQNTVPLPHQENSDNQLKKRLRLSGDIDIDLNSEVDLGRQKLDLNCWI